MEKGVFGTVFRYCETISKKSFVVVYRRARQPGGGGEDPHVLRLGIGAESREWSSPLCIKVGYVFGIVLR